MMGGHKDTWGRFVKILVAKEFTNENESLVTIDPDFMDIRNTPVADDILEKGHLTTSQRAMYAAEISTGKNSNITTVEAAKRLNVSRDSVQTAKKVKQVNLQLAKLVKSGKLSLSEAEMRIATSTMQ